MKLPAGFRSGGIHCGIKTGGSDLGVIVCDQPAEWAGVFTRNAAAAAPVEWSRSLRGRKVTALVVNSGNANACTGAGGRDAVARTVRSAAGAAGCSPENVLVASTGPIGVPLPVELIEAGIPRVLEKSNNDSEAFARSLMTTDTVIKRAEAPAGSARVVGIAKGAAMIAPNMATMLGFVLTDAAVDAAELQPVLSRAVEQSFNRISVDACESTNDSVFLMTSGREPCTASELEGAVLSVCRELAEMIVRDAEGASKFVRIRVEGAKDDSVATELGRAVASSDLWRAASGGGDPNWGRILSALGAHDRSLQIAKTSVSIGGETLFSAGAPCGDRGKAIAAMAEAEFEVHCRVGDGGGASEVLTCDLTPDYVKLNAEGAT